LNVCLYIIIYLLVAPLTSPSAVTTTPQTTSVQLSWTQSAMDVVDSYTINFMRRPGCTDALSGSRAISGSLRTYHLTGLEEDFTYDITITAINSINQMSITTSATTLTAGELLIFFSS